MLQGFVHQVDVRSLGEQGGCAGTLALSAGQRRIGTAAEPAEILRREFGGGNYLVRRAPAEQACRVRMAAQQNIVPYRAPEFRGLLLQEHTDAGRRLAPGNGVQRHAVQQYAPRLGRPQSRERSQQRGLAAAVASEYRPDLAGAEFERQAVDQRPARERRCADLQRAASLRPARSNNRTGTPSSAVSTPTGNCKGAQRLRARVSATTSRLPPASTEAGSSQR